MNAALDKNKMHLQFMVLKDHPFMARDKVKLSKHVLVFDKGYKPSWMLKILIVTEVIMTHSMVNRAKRPGWKEIAGTFYECKWQTVTSLSEVYSIEKVLKKKDSKLSKFNR